MEYRPFGQTGLTVSVLGFGASHVGASHCSEPEASRVLNEVLDSGITLIDTARMYGSSEERIGAYLNHRRSEFVLSSKCGYGIDGVEDWTGECVRRGVDEALARMRTDYLDIMHLHSCPAETLRRGDVIEALLEAKAQGKIRAVAYSGENEHRAYALETGSFDSIQTSVNICDQRVLKEATPLMMEKDLGVIAKRPMANAFWRFAEQPTGDYCETYWLRNKAMELDPGKLQWGEFALRFSAFAPGVHSCIVGTANLVHLRENIRHVGFGPLSSDIFSTVREQFDRADRDWVGQV